jgi:hypothetical protein
LVLNGGVRWEVGAGAERPVTEHPRSEHPLSQWTGLWQDYALAWRVIAGEKPLAILQFEPDFAERVHAQAEAAGLFAFMCPDHIEVGYYRTEMAVLRIASPGRLLDDEQVDQAAGEYAHLLPHMRMGRFIGRVGALHAEDVVMDERLLDPPGASGLVRTGIALGYPLASTAACIEGGVA